MLFTIIESIKKKLVMIGDLLLTLSAFWMNLVKLIKKLSIRIQSKVNIKFMKG